MLKTFYACPCGKKHASFEIHISRQPVNTRYPFVCEGCFNANLRKLFLEHKSDAPLPEWKVDESGTYVQLHQQESVDFFLRADGVETDEARTAELRKSVDVFVLELTIEGGQTVSARILKLEKETTSEPV